MAEVQEARRAAVLGKPVAHSLSPALHRAAYAALGLSGWRYDAIECDEPVLPALLDSFGDDVVGLSCTMPLKHAALAAAVEVSPAAATVGAANTLLRVAGGWRADNTDVDGVLGALAEAGVDAAHPPGSVLLLGAGGTAQAVVVALARLGVTAVDVGVRAPARAAALVATAAGVGVTAAAAPFPDALGADLVVSTLPGDAAAPLAARWGGAGRVLLDVVYAPWPTTLAQAAALQGATVVGGRSVLLHQAARQVELMTGRPAPVAAMRAALP